MSLRLCVSAVMTMPGNDIEQLVQHWVRPEIQALQAYHVPDASGLIKLDAMENPYTWPDSLKDDWLALLRGTDVNRYPDPHASALRERLHAVLRLPPQTELLLGNGSDELIQMICMALAGPGRSVLSVEPSFVMYRMIATFCAMRYVGVPLRAEDFSLDLDAVLEAIAVTEPAVVFLAYPNNPTGNLFERAALDAIIEAAPGLVVIDEAYAPFTDQSFVEELSRYPNLLVMHTLSKTGLAGLRLGMLAGPAAWLNEFDKVRLPYNINVLTQASAEFALRHRDLFDEQTTAIRAERSRLADALAAMPGLRVFPSEANFILVRVPAGRAGELFDGLKAGGVLVKRLDGSHPLLADTLRLTVGTPDENNALLGALMRVL
jgi:histidinol-phosphate aminotransferase